MTPLEEQLEKLARRWEKEADEGELLDEVAYALEGAADELRALLPLEVTDEITVKLDRGTAEYLLLVGTDEQSGEYFSDTYQGKVMPALRAALTQKGDSK